ncbi:B12-binding domain-containing radical SAM protein [Parashewanella tropica]|uniref:B12-binding domain-containing radical SAM protein n=1 Tax=Parashewanella tropica TaxID=2547970 RepID=UPI00105AAB4A|nr:radical SAM protein [Parashewanella tropica]
MNILIIKASAESDFKDYKKYMSSPPQGIFSLAAATPNTHSFEIVDETNGDKLTKKHIEWAHLAILTASTPDITHAYQLAQKLKENSLLVVLSGLHVTFLPAEAAHYADSVIIGEAELVWRALLADAEKGQLKPSYKSNEQVDMGNLNPWPNSPDLKKRYGTWGVLVGRGCKNSCSYCTVRPFFKREVFRPVAHVIDEIRASGKQYLELHADNLCSDPDYALELFTELKKLKVQWAGEATLDFAENEVLVEAAAKSGLTYLLVGLETCSHPALKMAGKGFIKPSRAKELIGRLHDNNIVVDSCMLFGFDEHEKDIFDETIAFVDDVKLDVIHPNFITPFPGTKFYNQLLREERLLSNDWVDYDCSHVVFEPKNMTPKELEDGVIKVRDTLYSTGRRLKRFARVTSMQGLYMSSMTT